MFGKHTASPCTRCNRASLWFFALLSLTLPAIAPATTCKLPAAQAVSVQGTVETAAPNTQHWTPLHQGDAICPGDRLRVDRNSRAALYLDNDTFLRLGELTTVVFPESTAEPGGWLELLRGVAHVMSRVKNTFEIITPYVNAAIEGTEFTVAVNDSQTEVTVLEGRVNAHNGQGSIALSDGQSVRARAGQAPVLLVMVRPRDAVHWTLFYPPVLYFDSKQARAPAQTGWREKLDASIAAYRRGDITQAFDALSGIGDIEDTDFYAYRAELKLSVGRSVAATSDLDRALALTAGDTRALALKSIIATTQNDPDAALQLAQRAISENALAAGPQIALSYAWQARAELDRARAAAEAAVTAEPGNALAWSRLAELQLMVRDVRDALKSAQRATELDPANAQTRTTLGFANLIRLDSEAAKKAFESAAGLSEAAPLPRLGLGLALIHAGHLAAGRHQIEIAANLDPFNALIRSYLGKSYYEEKRVKDANTQFALAKALDPLDPTAWFYDAILRQTDNRPVEALDDLQTAIALNDNRAVYRSRLLLDQDKASRDANLARVYDDLGFQQLALNESRKSLSTDPGNPSAHRFLSDAYTNVPRHEIARVSERLQSQLLQPATVVPVSPSGGEAKLLAFEGTGASTAGFNEFNPLFERKRLSLLASGLVGGNDTRSGEIVVGGFFNRGMISAGRFEERSDGVHDNNDTDQSIDNIYTQFQLTPELGIQGEYRNRNSAFGDLGLRMDQTVTDERRDIDIDSWRFGLNYSPSPRHTFLVSVIRQDLSDSVTERSISVNTENTGPQYEAQHIYRGRHLQTVAGIGYLDLQQDVTTGFSFFGIPFSDTTELDVEQKTAYLYTHIPWSNVEAVVGLDYVDIDEENGISSDQLNPKFGLSWDPDNRITVRLAAFRTLRGELVSSQTISPTQLVGFNQWFDDPLGTEAWRYGAGLDYRFSKDLAAGAEVSWRSISDPRVDIVPTPAITTDHRDEQAHTAYAYWTPTANLALSAEYRFDYFKRDYVAGEIDIDRPAKTTMHSFPLVASFFHSSGFYTRFQTSYVRQEVSNVRLSSGTEELHDNFWISDLSVGYRLPRRYGLIDITVRNLFDEDFQYQSTDPGTGAPLTSPYYPEAAVFMGLQLWL